MGIFEDFRKWAVNNKLKAVGYIWGGGVATSLAYQWTRPIPTQLKLIHTRMYAQGFTLAALGAIAAVTFLEEGTGTPRTSEERLPGATAGVAAAK